MHVLWVNVKLVYCKSKCGNRYISTCTVTHPIIYIIISLTLCNMGRPNMVIGTYTCITTCSETYCNPLRAGHIPPYRYPHYSARDTTILTIRSTDDIADEEGRATEILPSNVHACAMGKCKTGVQRTQILQPSLLARTTLAVSYYRFSTVIDCATLISTWDNNHAMHCVRTTLNGTPYPSEPPGLLLLVHNALI